jgi:hypothetical protein
MKNQRLDKQKGASLWVFVWGAALAICFSYLIIIGLPPYLGNQKIYNSLERLAEDDDIMKMSRLQMVRLLNRKLNIDYADTIVKVDKAFKYKNVEGKRQLSIDYELVVPLVYNISLLYDFENHVLAPKKN